jgi:hypothetical protein
MRATVYCGWTMTDLDQMAICAVRYCIGRRSYVVSEGARWAVQAGTRSREARIILIEDLRSARDRGALGDPPDAGTWLTVLKHLEDLG